jgi:hypothetical protein
MGKELFFGSAFAPDFTISLSLDFWVLGYKKIFFKKSYIDAILVLRLGSYSRLVTIPIPSFFLEKSNSLYLLYDHLLCGVL